MEDANERTAEGSDEVTSAYEGEEDAGQPPSSTHMLERANRAANTFNQMDDEAEGPVGVPQDRSTSQKSVHHAVYQWHLCTFALTSL